ncbi:MAG TPA: DUF4255 domain-containing protein [Gemmataceae bacterium]|nr:DUF4255 domain-containing protein [Gemmataceae bacterium]
MLRRLLQVTIKGVAFPDPKVTTMPPSTDLPNEHGANLYLYRVVESPYSKNQDWRGDRKPTLPSSRPVLALQLFYLITPLSKKETLDEPDKNRGEEAHEILGAIMLAIQENPILNNVHLPDLDADKELSESLRNSFEQVKITLLPTDVNELSKIWATINQPYRLSIAYEVSLVELTPTPPTAKHGGIVLRTDVDVITFDPPRLNLLTPPSGALARIVNDKLVANELQISGFGLKYREQLPIVRVGGNLVEIKKTPAPTAEALTVTLPAELDAGPQVDVRVTLNSRTSTPLTFAVSPWLASTQPVRTTLEELSGGTKPKLVLTGNGFSATPKGVRFDGPTAKTISEFDPNGTDKNATVSLPDTLENGVYEIRILTTNANDVVASNARTLEVLPFVAKVEPEVRNNVHKLTVSGKRLKGTDIRLVIDGVTYVAPANPNDNPIVYTLNRLLNAGTHSLALNLDGHLSHTKEFTV